MRARITALATLVTVVVLTITAVALVLVQRRQLTDNLDASLRQRALDIETILLAEDDPQSLPGGSGDDVLIQIVDDTTVVYASPTVGVDEPIASSPDDEATRYVATRSGVAVEDDVFRVLTIWIDTAEGPRTLHVGASYDDVVDATRILATSLTIAIPLVAAVLAAATWWLVGRALRPVEAIRSEVADIGARELHRRVPKPATGDEVEELAETMNEMLARLEDASVRQQRFVADASHELRSPLTRIRSELEVDLAYPDEANVRATHRSVLDETTGLQALVDDLLELARLDASVMPRTRVPVDLDDIVMGEIRAVRIDSRATIDAKGVSAARVLGDPRQLARVVRNLLDNASRHASASVAVSLAEDETTAVLAVSDDGAGVPPDRRTMIFDRFARADDARSPEQGGTGLGLAIAHDIVAGHGGSIRVEDAPDGGARFVVSLPRLVD